MKKCKIATCILSKTIEVPYSGNTGAKVVFVGESPWREEELAGKPFVGKSGKFLRKAISKLGLVWDDFLILNSARCTIDKKELQTKQISDILKCCRPKIEFILHKVSPKLVIALGDFALKQILKKTGITKHRGQFIWSSEFNCWVLSTYHPSYICNRNMSLNPRFENDLKLVNDFIINNYERPLNIEKKSYLDIDSSPELFNVFKEDVKKWALDGNSIGIDTETQGLDPLDPNFVFISYSISGKKNTAYQIRLYEEIDTFDEDCIVIKHKRILSGQRKKSGLVDVYIKPCVNYRKKISILKYILENKKIKKNMMTMFDMKVFDSCGIEVNNFTIDIQAGANIIDENLYSMASLGDLQTGFTDISGNYKQDFANANNKSDMLAVDKKNRNAFNKYACQDADTTRQVAIALKEELKKIPRQLRYFVKFTMPVEKRVLFKLEKNGVYFNKNDLPETQKYIDFIMNKTEKKALSLVSTELKKKHKEKGLSLTRGVFVQDILFSFSGFNLNPIRKTKTGWSVDKETRISLLSSKISKEAKKFIKAYDKFLETHTLSTRYFAGFDKHIKSDDRIHSHFTLTKAVTGRTASSAPNLQNLPKRSELAPEMRKLIIPKKGYIFLAADAAQSELRIIAHVAQDKEMMRVFNANEDIHTNTAKALTTKKWDSLLNSEKKKLRYHAKPINFGLIYGMGLNGFINYTKMEYGLDLSKSAAMKWINLFFNTYKSIKRYHRDTIDFCKKYGYVESCLGRRRRLYEINSTDSFLRNNAERQAINFPIQGPSSDAVLLAGAEIDKLELDPEDFKLVLFVHDELVFEVKDSSRVLDYAKLIKKHMENPPFERDFGVKLKVPLKTDVKCGYNLNELKEVLI